MIDVSRDNLLRVRRQLHMYPELGWDLDRTSALVRSELERYGIPCIPDRFGRNSVVVDIHPEKEGFTMGLRADMDALPIQENNRDKPYRSRIDGCMHACGHDAHTSMMLETARILWGMRDQLRCRVRIIFQPSEESRPSGARVLCENGVLQGVDCMIMCHVNCVDPVHGLSCNSHVTNCSSMSFRLEIHGRSVHVATPHAGIDALSAGVKVYQGIQTMISRETDPFDTLVMAVTCMHAGTTVSTNADSCVMEGSIRCLRNATMDWAQERLRHLLECVCEECGTTFTLTFNGPPIPVARNHPLLYKAFVESAEKVTGPGSVIDLPTSPGAEDFAYYEQHVPGLLFGLGMRNPEKNTVYPAHTKDWDIDEDGMETGVKVFCQFVLDHMDGIPGLTFLGEV